MEFNEVVITTQPSQIMRTTVSERTFNREPSSRPASNAVIFVIEGPATFRYNTLKLASKTPNLLLTTDLLVLS